MKNKHLFLIFLFVTSVSCTPKSNEKPAEKPMQAAVEAPAAKAEKPARTDFVEFLGIADGETIGIERRVDFVVKGKKVRPAGEAPEEKTTGHHHVIIDGSAMAEGTIIPMDEKHLHFGKGQTSTVLKLTPGAHTLTLQFADGAHRSYGPAWSQTIKVSVDEAADEPKDEAVEADTANLKDKDKK